MKEEDTNWVCPNDRQLLLRAKLSAGWCVRAKGQNGTKNSTDTVSETELKHIQKIISKAEVLERLEQERIGCLVHRLELMVKNSMGDGVKCCLLCSEDFGKFRRTSPFVCMECRKKVCEKCCIDYASGKTPQEAKQQTNAHAPLTRLWLCKICRENKEVWKRTGAWFFKTLPKYLLPNDVSKEPNGIKISPSHKISKTDSKVSQNPNLLAPNESLQGHHRTLSGNSVTSFQWAKPTAKDHESSSYESSEEDSSDDDGITLGKQPKSPLKNFDQRSISSSNSLNPRNDSDDSMSSSGVSRRSGRRTATRRDKLASDGLTRRHFPYQQEPEKVPEEQDVVSIDSRVTDASNEDRVDSTSSALSVQSEDTVSITSEQYSKSATEIITDGSRGYIEFSILYDPVKLALHVTIIKAKNLQAKDANGLSDPYIKLHLLPGSSRDNMTTGSKATKLRTKTKWKTLNPEFNERLSYFGIMEEELANRTLRLTVLDEDR